MDPDRWSQTDWLELRWWHCIARVPSCDHGRTNCWQVAIQFPSTLPVFILFSPISPFDVGSDGPKQGPFIAAFEASDHSRSQDENSQISPKVPQARRKAIEVTVFNRLIRLIPCWSHVHQFPSKSSTGHSDSAAIRWTWNFATKSRALPVTGCTCRDCAAALKPSRLSAITAQTTRWCGHLQHITAESTCYLILNNRNHEHGSSSWLL